MDHCHRQVGNICKQPSLYMWHVVIFNARNKNLVGRNYNPKKKRKRKLEVDSYYVENLQMILFDCRHTLDCCMSLHVSYKLKGHARKDQIRGTPWSAWIVWWPAPSFFNSCLCWYIWIHLWGMIAGLNGVFSFSGWAFVCRTLCFCCLWWKCS